MTTTGSSVAADRGVERRVVVQRGAEERDARIDCEGHSTSASVVRRSTGSARSLTRPRFARARELTHALRVSTTIFAMSAHALVVDVRVIGDDQHGIRLADAVFGQLHRAPDGA